MTTSLVASGPSPFGRRWPEGPDEGFARLGNPSPGLRPPSPGGRGTYNRCSMKPIVAFLAAFLSLAVLTAQTPGSSPFRIERLDPALDDVIAPDAQLEMLGDRFALTEGPVWIPRANNQPGYLLFSDNAANVIYK